MFTECFKKKQDFQRKRAPNTYVTAQKTYNRPSSKSFFGIKILFRDKVLFIKHLK